MNLPRLSNLELPNLFEFDREKLINEIIEKIKKDPEWRKYWDGDLLHNSSFFFLNLFAFLFEKNATYINKLVRENFLLEAHSKRAIKNILNQRNIPILENTHAAVEITGEVLDGVLDEDLFIPVLTKLEATNLDGGISFFEFITFDDNNKPNYFNNIVIPYSPINSKIFKVYVYSGLTKTKEFNLNNRILKNFEIELDDENIIQDSIRVFFDLGGPYFLELKETDTFITELEPAPSISILQELFKYGIPLYQVKYLENGRAKIVFGSGKFGGEFAIPTDFTLTIFYRVGGGKSDNIVPYSISKVLNFENSKGEILKISFFNESFGFGGTDRENLEEIKFLGPLRIGGIKTITSAQKAESVLYKKVIKHKILEAQYNENPEYNKVQLLHTFHYFVPFRDFNNFIFPEIIENDNLETYKEKFLKELNNFLNVKGISDKEIYQKATSFFIELLENSELENPFSLDFYYKLPTKNPLNGTLFFEAFDFSGNLIDKIVFYDNYSMFSSTPCSIINERAILKLPFPEEMITLTAQNDRRLEIIYGNQFENLVTIILPEGVYSINNFVNLVNDLLASTTYALNFQNLESDFKWCYKDEENNVVFQTPDFYREAKIKINPTQLTSILGWNSIISKPKYAETFSGRVFDRTACFYSHNNYEAFLKIFNDSLIIQKEFSFNINNYYQDNSVSSAPNPINFELLDEFLNKIQVVENSTIEIFALDSNNNVLDYIIIPNISKDSRNFFEEVSSGTYETNFTVFKDFNNPSELTEYKYEDSILSIYLKDPEPIENEEEETTYEYPLNSNFNQVAKVAKFKIVLFQKTYNNIFVGYKPNEYYLENEAKELMSFIKARKLLCHEHLIKSVQFEPIKIKLQVFVKRGSKISEIKREILDAIEICASYENFINEFQIGKDFNLKTLVSYLSDIRFFPGLKDILNIKILNENEIIPDDSEFKNKYFFVLPKNFLTRMKNFELENITILEGFTSLFEPEIIFEII